MAEVRVGNDLTEARPICRGIRQGCVLSFPLLFNLYSEAIFHETLEERNVGVKGEWCMGQQYSLCGRHSSNCK